MKTKVKAAKIIREKKRRGDIIAVAKRLEITPQWVSVVCNPKSKYWYSDESVVAALLERIAKRQLVAEERISKQLQKLGA